MYVAIGAVLHVATVLAARTVGNAATSAARSVR